MEPPAPGLVSMKNVCPSILPRRSAVMRAIVSVTPPGAYGTTTLTVRVGQACARDAEVPPASITHAAIAAIEFRSNTTAFPPRRRNLMVAVTTRPLMHRFPATRNDGPYDPSHSACPPAATRRHTRARHPGGAMGV